MSTVLFSTGRLAARPKAPTDALALHEVFGDAEAMQYLGGPLPTLARTEDFVAQHIAHQQAHGFSMWTLIERAAAEVIGDVGILVHATGVEVGWHLRRSSWGQGFATEAARACLTYGATCLDLRHVSAFVESANMRSIRVIEKLGMNLVRVEEGDGVPPWREYRSIR